MEVLTEIERAGHGIAPEILRIFATAQYAGASVVVGVLALLVWKS